TDVVCGDVFLIDGQSNAVATDYHGEDLGNAARNPFVRSFGSGVRDASVREDTAFSVAVAYPANSHGSVGQWGLHLANLLVQAHGVPILLINGAVGGTRVDQHQRNDADPEDASTIYGRLLWRVRRAGVADQVRGILWHQGESDGGLAYDTYLARWTAMYDDWLADYPGVEGVFVFQVRAGCGNPTWNRNVARDLPALLPRVLGSMSTTGVDGHDNCHFFHAVYVEWGERMARLVRRALYGAEIAGNIDAPSPVSARWRAPNEVAIEFGATGGGLLLQPGAAAYFSLADGAQVLDARVEGTAVVLTTAAASQAAWVTFADVPGDIPWLVNDLGIGAFAFYALPIAPRAP
ncbi:MAG: hypothetical protein H6702_18895, partial [Myxococcales bacterium]|nr:hypothetical protein [Myxococcales bacterium]